MPQQNKIIKLPSNYQTILKKNIIINIKKTIHNYNQQSITKQTYKYTLKTNTFQTLITI